MRVQVRKHAKDDWRKGIANRCSHRVYTKRNNRILSVQTRRQDTNATYLDETDGGGLLTEALTAEVEAVLADETSLVRTVAAVEDMYELSSESPFTVSYLPLTAALAVFAGAREPNGVVGHFE